MSKPPVTHCSRARRTSASQLLGVRNLDGGSGRGRHRRGLPQHWEQAHQGIDVARQQHFSLVPQTSQSLRERIDHAVERLVGDGFALVAAAGQHGCPRVRPNAAEEAIDQRRLAHARTTLDEDGHGRAFARSCLRGFQRLELGLPPKEDRCRPLRGHAGRDVGTSQPSQHFRALRPLVGVPMDERGRKLGEILRNAVATQRRRLSPDLCVEHLDHRALEGQPPGEDVVKHRAHAVLIAGRAQLRAGGFAPVTCTPAFLPSDRGSNRLPTRTAGRSPDRSRGGRPGLGYPPSRSTA